MTAPYPGTPPHGKILDTFEDQLKAQVKTDFLTGQKTGPARFKKCVI